MLSVNNTKKNLKEEKTQFLYVEKTTDNYSIILHLFFFIYIYRVGFLLVSCFCCQDESMLYVLFWKLRQPLSYFLYSLLTLPMEVSILPQLMTCLF